jgi:hypothetical protein
MLARHDWSYVLGIHNGRDNIILRKMIRYFFPLLHPEQGMSDPIGLREFNKAAYRKLIRTLSDEELLKAGKRLRILCGDVVTRHRVLSTDSSKFAGKTTGADIRNDGVESPQPSSTTPMAQRSNLTGRKAPQCNLYVRITKERSRYVADFFTEDGTFVCDLSAPRDSMSVEHLAKLRRIRDLSSKQENGERRLARWKMRGPGPIGYLVWGGLAYEGKRLQVSFGEETARIHLWQVVEKSRR